MHWTQVFRKIIYLLKHICIVVFCFPLHSLLFVKLFDIKLYHHIMNMTLDIQIQKPSLLQIIGSCCKSLVLWIVFCHFIMFFLVVVTSYFRRLLIGQFVCSQLFCKIQYWFQRHKFLWKVLWCMSTFHAVILCYWWWPTA